ncbi:MAG: Gfo/Idh/MocA family oxidoreductase [Novosphingobium sp.]
MTRIVPLRLGIVGANVERGWFRDAHFPALQMLPGFAIQAVSARTQEIADAAAAAFGAAEAYDDSLALARDPEVDVVVVTVKVPEHRAIVLAALAAGKCVYCEWPLGRDLAEAKDMAAAALAAGTYAVVGLQGVNAPAVRHAAALVREGAIGRPLNLRVVSSTAGWGTAAPAHYAYLQDKRNGATLATIAGGHTLAMVEAVAGPIVEVSARCSILQPSVSLAGSGETVTRTCADHMLIVAKHESGCVSSVEIVGGANIPLRFELRGTAGSLGIEGHHPGGYQCGHLEVTSEPPLPPQPKLAVAGLSGNPLNVAQLYARLEQDMRNGARTAPDFDAAVRLTRLLDAIDAASDQGTTMKVTR